MKLILVRMVQWEASWPDAGMALPLSSRARLQDRFWADLLGLVEAAGRPFWLGIFRRLDGPPSTSMYGAPGFGKAYQSVIKQFPWDAGVS